MNAVPRGWQKSVLGDAVSISRGISYASTELTEVGNGRPLINLRNVDKGGGFRADGVKYYTGAVKERHLIEPGDLLIANTDLSKTKDVLGSPIVIPSNFNLDGAVFSLDLTKLVVDEDTAMRKFVTYFLMSPLARKFMKDNGSGTTVMHLQLNALPRLELLLPPLSEQQRIVEILEEQFSRLDAAVSSIRTVREKAAAFRRSLLQAVFVGQFSEQTNGEWKIEPLSNVAQLSLGVMLDKAKETGENQFPYLGNINVRWGSFETGNLKTMQVLPSQIDRATVRFNDVIVCEGGEPGRCAIWRGEESIFIQKALHRVRPSDAVISTYLYYFFEFRFRDVQSDELFTGTTIRHLPKQKLATLEVPLPSRDEQVRIVSIIDEQFSRLDAALDVANQLEDRIRSERLSLLHAAFSGTLTTQWRETNNG